MFATVKKGPPAIKFVAENPRACPLDESHIFLCPDFTPRTILYDILTILGRRWRND